MIGIKADGSFIELPDPGKITWIAGKAIASSPQSDTVPVLRFEVRGQGKINWDNFAEAVKMQGEKSHEY